MLEDLYSVHLPKKTHPWCYMSLEIDPHNIDVNVHPTKHEVRFLHEDSIIEKIKIALDEKLSGVSATRTFYMKSKLPNVDVTKNILKEVLPDYDSQKTDKTKKPYAYQMIRTNSSDQKLDKFSFTINSSAKNEKVIFIENTDKDKSKESEESEKKIEEKKTKSKEFESNENIENIENITEIETDKEMSILEATNLETSNNLEDYAMQEDNSTCFMLSDSDESNAEVSKNNKPIDFELESADSSLIADKAMERIYKHWGGAPKTKENKEINKEIENEKSNDDIQKENETDKKDEETPEFKSYSVNNFRREVKLKSILLLRKKVEDNYHSGLREILSNLIFIGCVDEGFSLIQSGINLYISNTQSLV